MKEFIKYFIDRPIFVNLLTVIVLLTGGFYTVNMNREAFPNIDFDIVTVTTIFPGASAKEVEKLVTIPIEDELKSVSDIKKIESSSLENRSGIAIWIDPDAKSTRKVIDDIRSAVDRVKNLPTDAESPLIQEVTSTRQPIVEIAFGIKQKDGKPMITEKELRDIVYNFERRVLDLKGVATTVKRGYRDREMLIELDPAAMNRFYVSSNQVVQALAQKNINSPGGKLKTPREEFVVRTIGEFSNVEEIRKVYVRSNDLGDFVRVQDVANVVDGLKEQDQIEKTNGLQSISVTIVKKERADAIKTVDEVFELVKKYKAKLPPSVEVYDVNDLSFFVRRRLSVLVNNVLVGVILVIASLFLFLNWRIALMVALGMITAMAIAFLYMGYYGSTLNLMSMFGLVIVIGMVVDDSIIVAENIYRYLEEGMSAYDASVRGTTEVIAPVTATIITSLAAFAPLMFMSGIMGKFTFFIPFVVVVTLVASLVESFVFLPSHIYDISRRANAKKIGQVNKGERFFLWIRDKLYTPSIHWALNHRWQSLMIMNILLIASVLVLVKFGKFKLFSGSIDRYQVKIEAPRGHKLEQTDEYVQVIEKLTSQLPKTELENFTTRVGIISKGVNDPQTKRGTNYANIIVYLTPETNRKKTTEQIIEEMRQKTAWLIDPSAGKNKKESVNKEKSKEQNTNKKTDKKKIAQPNSKTQVNQAVEGTQEFAHLKGKLLKLEFEKMQGGPPVGKPVSIEIRGNDFEVLQKIAKIVETELKKIPHTEDVANDLSEGKSEVRVIVDERRAAYAGVTVGSIASAIRTAFEGTIATSIRKTNEEIDVRVRFPDSYRSSLKSLNEVYVANQQGQLIPLSSLVKYQQGVGVEYINHLDNERVIKVLANVNEKKTTSAEVNAKLKKVLANIEDDFPGYTIRFGGENEDTQESLSSLSSAFGVAALIIFLILASLFRSLLQPAVVMMAIPFAFIGVIIAFVTHGQYFGFIAIMGIVGLSGVVVNDSIVLVDFANKIRSEKPELTIKEVAEEAGRMRLRAVILTTLTTVLGLLPTAYGLGGTDPFLIPAALAFSWGLTFSTSITLIIVPILYTWIFDLKRVMGNLVQSIKVIFQRKAKDAQIA